MTPPTEWPIGCQYAIITTVTHKSHFGLPDPSITERICLPHEVPGIVASIMAKNPYATAWASATKTWRGHQL